MRKIFFILSILFCVVSKSQVYQTYPQFGMDIKRIQPLYSLGLPGDTSAIPADHKTFPQIAAKGDSIYLWSTRQQKYILYTGGSGGGSVESRRDTLLSGVNIIDIGVKPYGQINNDSIWANLTPFNNRGGTWSISGSKIRGAGFTGVYTETLDLITNLKTDSGFTNLPKWRLVAKARVLNAAGNGFGFGIRSYTTNSLNDLFFQFHSSSGNTYIRGTSTGTQLAISSSAVTVSNNDELLLTFERDQWAITVTVRNLTTNSATVTTTYTYNPVTPDGMQNTGRFAIYGFGGGTPEFQVDSLAISSKEIMNADVLIVGDSKTDGYQVASDARYASLLARKYSVVVQAGGYETTAEWIRTNAERIALKPRQVLLTNPSNDARTSVNVDSTKNRYYRIERGLRSIAGSDVYHLNAFYETGSTPNAWYDHIRTTRLADSVINTMDPTRAAGSNTVDNVHLTVQGNLTIYNAIMDAGKLFWLNESSGGSSLSSGDFIQNAPASQQTARFNITNTSRNTLLGYLDLGTGTAVTGLTDIPLRIKTGTNMNVWFYSDNTNNYLFSSDGSNSTFKPMRIGSSTFDLYGGASASIPVINSSSAGDVTIPQHVILGSTGLGGTIAVTMIPYTNNAFNFYDASNDEQYFSSTQSGNGGGRTMHITGLDLRLEDKTAGSTVTERMRIDNTGILLSQQTASRFVTTDGSKYAITSAVASSVLAASVSDETGTGVAVFNNAPAFVGVPTGTITSGQWNPSPTAVANAGSVSSTSTSGHFTRIGNEVTFTCTINVTPTAGATITSVGFALPVASNFTTTNDMVATGVASVASYVDGQGYADATNDRGQIDFISINTSGHIVNITGHYIIK